MDEVWLAIQYKDRPLNCRYRADLICFGDIVVELKAIDRLTGADDAQLINYLKATGQHRGLLLNFGAVRLEYRRIVYGPPG
jgi:GxxExxY protein